MLDSRLLRRLAFFRAFTEAAGDVEDVLDFVAVNRGLVANEARDEVELGVVLIVHVFHAIEPVPQLGANLETEPCGPTELLVRRRPHQIE